MQVLTIYVYWLTIIVYMYWPTITIKCRIANNRAPLHKVSASHSSDHMGQLSVTEALHYSNLVQLFLCFHCFWLLIVITYSYSFSVSAPLWSGPCFYLCAIIKVGMSELVPAKCSAGPVSQNQSNRRESNIYISQIYNIFFKFSCFAAIIIYTYKHLAGYRPIEMTLPPTRRDAASTRRPTFNS